MKTNKEMTIDEFVELRAWCFRLLRDIADKQMNVAKNVRQSRAVKDYDVYIKKKQLELSALSGAKATVDTLIKNIDVQGDISKTLKKIEDSIKNVGD